jgi:hypothetical protein
MTVVTLAAAVFPVCPLSGRRLPDGRAAPQKKTVIFDPYRNNDDMPVRPQDHDALAALGKKRCFTPRRKAILR